jgi:hypothetical protein
LKKTKGNDSLAVKKTKFKRKRSAGQWILNLIQF